MVLINIKNDISETLLQIRHINYHHPHSLPATGNYSSDSFFLDLSIINLFVINA